MANELRHEDTVTGTTLQRTDWEDVGSHRFDSQATGDIAYASSVTQLSRLGIGAAETILTVTGGIPAWTATPSLTGLTIGASDLDIGANKIIATANLFYEDVGGTFVIRNLADTLDSNLKLRSLLFSNILYATTNGLSITATDTDNFYLKFTARDTGVGLVEVARLQGAGDPYMCFTGIMAVVPTNANLPIGFWTIEYTSGANATLYVNDAGVIKTLVLGAPA